MKVEKDPKISGVIILEPAEYHDNRGSFMETWNILKYDALGIPVFVQDNLSRSGKGVLRGLHLQTQNPQGKLVYVPFGEVLDVVVDVRKDSPTFGNWNSYELSATNCRQVYVPPGCAHGFYAKATSLFAYKCTALYDPHSEVTIAWNDPELAIKWGTKNPIMSTKDLAGISMSRFCIRNMS